MNFRWREAGLLLVLLTALALVLALDPIRQDPAYHALADTRALFGIPNFFNVTSNAAFLIVGIAGLRWCFVNKGRGASASWTLFFFGIALIAAGSAYYHLAPGDGTLVWDRLPMTVAFMGCFVAIVSEHLDAGLERKLLVPAVVLGIASVVWWKYTDDLRLYAWVQLAPLLAVLYLMTAFPGRYSHRAYLIGGTAIYAAAKVCEFQDGAIFEMTSGIVSGHTLKHVAAALGAYFVYLMLRGREPIAAGDPARI